MMKLRYIHAVREFELEQVIRLLPPPTTLLEIGAGTGWQAKALSANGYDVVAVDLPINTRYKNERVFPVVEYDGVNLPFDNGAFNIIFSSHVMEHVSEFERLQHELRRVLSSDGIVVHVVPSAVWRIATTVTHYPAVLKALYTALRKRSLTKESAMPQVQKSRSLLEYVARALVPFRHGETGNAMTETYYFSEFYWRRLFEKNGWIVERQHIIPLFYSGSGIFEDRLHMKTRHYLSKIFGASSHLFVLKNKL